MFTKALKPTVNKRFDMFCQIILTTVNASFLFMCVFNKTNGYIYTDRDGVTVEYKVTMGSFCGNKGETFNTFVGIPLAECAKECGARKHCQGLRYHKRYKLCELLSGPNNGIHTDGSCIFIPASDIVFKQDCSHCTDEYKTCNAKTNECEYKECTDVDKGTWLRGNMRSVGNKIMQRCDEGYNYSVCLTDGTWSKNDVCKQLVNVALGKTASMSSYHHGNFPADLGVDDNMTTFFHTVSESNPWWRVDLGSVFDVIKVNVFNRDHPTNTEVVQRAKNFSLQLGMTTDTLLEYGRVDELGPDKTFELPANTFARYVQTQMYTTNFFHLFEVQVMAVSP